MLSGNVAPNLKAKCEPSSLYTWITSDALTGNWLPLSFPLALPQSLYAPVRNGSTKCSRKI